MLQPTLLHKELIVHLLRSSDQNGCCVKLSSRCPFTDTGGVDIKLSGSLGGCIVVLLYVGSFRLELISCWKTQHVVSTIFSIEPSLHLCSTRLRMLTQQHTEDRPLLPLTPPLFLTLHNHLPLLNIQFIPFNEHLILLKRYLLFRFHHFTGFSPDLATVNLIYFPSRFLRPPS